MDSAFARQLEQELGVISRHMECCRSILGVPNDETLAVAIQEMSARLTAANQRIRELTEWRPIDDDTPLDTDLQLGWLESYTEKRWRQEIKWAGHKNDKGPGMSNGWLHGQATHWLPLTPPPAH